MLKQFEGIIILNVKTGAMRVVKKSKNKLLPHEVTVGFKIGIEQEETEKPNVEATVRIPKKKFNEIVLDSI